MDRVYTKYLISLGFFVGASLIAMRSADAQSIQLAHPSVEDEMSDDGYSESKFGQAPADPTTHKIRMPASLKVARPTMNSLAGSSKSGIQEVSMILTDSGFFPQALFVTQEIPVRLFVTSASKSGLCLMIDEFDIRKSVSPQKIEELSFTPKIAGVYRIHCPAKGLEGSLVVKEPPGLASERVPEAHPEALRIPASSLEQY